MFKVLVGIVILTTLPALARKTDGQYNVDRSNNLITLTPKEGFHFNEKAPASIEFDHKSKQKPEIKTEKVFTFKINPNSQKAKLNFYICDDAKTVCEPHIYEITSNKKSASNESSIKTEDSGVAIENVKKDSKKIDKIKVKSKPTLLVFSAPWCPACIRLKSETLSTPEIKKMLSGYEVSYINIDLVQNEQISDEYGVKAIPTMILVDDAGSEIKRWLDFQDKNIFQKDFKSAVLDASIDQLVDKANGGDINAAIKLGYNAYAKMKWEEASKWLSLSKNKKDLNVKLASDVNLASDNVDDKKPETKTEYLNTLERAFSLTTSEIDQLRWKIEYLENQNETDKRDIKNITGKIKDHLNKLLVQKKLQNKFLDSTYGDYTQFEKIEILDMLKRLNTLVKSEDASVKLEKENLKKDIKIALDQVKLNVEQPGKYLSAIWYYTQIEEFDKAEGLYQALINKYNDSYVYYQKYANFLMKQKRYDDALKNIDLALKYKEGNEPQLNLVKIRILKELNKKNEARTLIEDTLKITEQYPAKYKRTQTTLMDLKKSL